MSNDIPANEDDQIQVGAIQERNTMMEVRLNDK
jgi:hypothetical protein